MFLRASAIASSTAVSGIATRAMPLVAPLTNGTATYIMRCPTVVL